MTGSRTLHRVREQAQRQPGRFEQRDSSVVSKQSRRVARIGIAHRPQLFVITTDERRTTANAATQNGKVHRVAQLDHGGGLVEVVSGEKLGCQASERLLHRDQDFTRVRSQAGDVEQHEQHARRPHPQELVEIAGHTLAAIHRGNLGMTQHWRIAMERIDQRRCHFIQLEQRAPETRRL